MKNIAERAKAAHAQAVKSGFWEGELNTNLDLKIALIHSELSEALEEFRRTDQDLAGLNKIVCGIAEGDSSKPYKPVGFLVELADAVIRIFDLAARLEGAELLESRFQHQRYSDIATVNFPRKLAYAHRAVSTACMWLQDMNWGGSFYRSDGAIWELARALVHIEDMVTLVGGDKRGDLDEAIDVKMAYNATRLFRHGKQC
jgi:hypothetical protein